MVSKTIVKIVLLINLLFVSAHAMTGDENKRLVPKSKSGKQEKIALTRIADLLKEGDTTAGKVTVVLGKPSDPELAQQAAQAPEVKLDVHVFKNESGQADEVTLALSMSDGKRVQALEESEELEETPSSGWCGLKKYFSRCFSRRTIKQCDYEHNSQRATHCAYIFFKNRCIKIVFSGLATVTPLVLGGLLTNAYVELLLKIEPFNFAAMFGSMYSPSLMCSFMIIGLHLAIFQADDTEDERVLIRILAGLIPIQSMMCVYYLSPFAQTPNQVTAIMCSGSIVAGSLVFGIYKETCSPDGILGKPMTEWCRIMLKNPYNVVLKKLEHFEESYEGMRDCELQPIRKDYPRAIGD